MTVFSVLSIIAAAVGVVIGLAIIILVVYGVILGIIRHAKRVRADDKREIRVTGDCERCWCDTCARLNTCAAAPPDFRLDIRPYPCTQCLDGKPFMPVRQGKSPRCVRYRRENQ